MSSWPWMGVIHANLPFVLRFSVRLESFGLKLTV